MFYKGLPIFLFICLSIYIYIYVISVGEQTKRWCARAHTRVGQGGEEGRERERELSTLSHTRHQSSHTRHQRALVERSIGIERRNQDGRAYHPKTEQSNTHTHIHTPSSLSFFMTMRSAHQIMRKTWFLYRSQLDVSWISPEVQSHLSSLYDYVIKTVFLPLSLCRGY